MAGERCFATCHPERREGPCYAAVRNNVISVIPRGLPRGTVLSSRMQRATCYAAVDFFISESVAIFSCRRN
jgi:hypothetical protein